MHHARGLVRPVAAKALKNLEQLGTVHDLKDCFRHTVLQDSQGQTCVTHFLHPGALMARLENLTGPEALSTVEETLGALSVDAQTASSATPQGDAVPVLYVKGTVEACRTELVLRERRFVLKLKGRQLAADPALTKAFVEHLLSVAAATRPNAVSPVHSEDDCSVYYGLLEALCATDPRAAISLGVNSKLPPLNAAVAHGLSQLVDVSTASAITTFLALVAEKDTLVAAHERCATHLAQRVRQAAPQHLGLFLSNRTALEALDPGVVFPTSAENIQAFTMKQPPECAAATTGATPTTRAEAVMSLVRKGKWLPKRVAMTALSSVCLTDLERDWLAATVTCYAAPGGRDSESTQRASRALALKDVRRNLVDNRLLRAYAELLRDGDISASDDASFPAFLEECGECHSAQDRPTHIEFTVSPRADHVTLSDALVNLAPGCSYWTTLVRQRPSLITSTSLAPCEEVRVVVTLPEHHECCTALNDTAFRATLPEDVRKPRILWEDDHVLAVDKPAGIATSRHALSATQSGQPVTDLLSCLVRERPTLGEVFRDGQVHRLDTGTSGCILFAKTALAAASLRHQMGTSAAYSHFSKTYWALCAVLETDLTRVPLKGVLRDRADTKIQTAYRVVKFLPAARVALVECRLQQGKKHQVRRHLASTGLPLLGDVDHGGAACCHPLMSRVALHAKSLTFVHPVSRETVAITAPLPKDFSEAMHRLASAQQSDTWHASR